MVAPASTPHPIALWESAQRQILEGRLDEAWANLQGLLAIEPRHAGAHMLLAGIVMSRGKVRGALEQLQKAASVLGNDVGMIARIARSLSKLGDTNAARACLQHPAIARSRDGAALTALGHICQGMGLNNEALELMDRARAVGFDNADFRYYRALQLQFNGRLEEAERELDSCLRMSAMPGRAALSLARIRKWTRQDNHVDFLRGRLQAVKRGGEDHAALEFALHKELDDLGELDDAWAALRCANDIMANRLPHDVAGESRLFDAIAQRFDAAFMSQPSEVLAGPTPIFIVGMPRSGTTLLERLLGSHSLVASAGELNDMPRQLRWVADRHGQSLIDPPLLEAMRSLDFGLLGSRYLEQSQWRASGKPYYVDKLPPNFMLVGCIRRALPHAKVIHMVRDPMDVCFSNYRAMFGDAYAYSYRFDTLASHHHLYRRLMRHWNQATPGFVIDVSYAELVLDTEAAGRKLLDAVGIPFETGCLDHTRNRSTVATLSSAQVRQPIHVRGLGEWKRYASQLEPLRAMVEAGA